MTGSPITLPDVLAQLLNSLINFIPQLIASLVLFFGLLYLTGLIERGLRRGLERRKTDPGLILLLLRLTRLSLVILAAVLALQQIGFNLTAFLAGLGIIGFTIGFALQDVSKNFVAGMILLIQQPFSLGESIEVSGFSGTVTAIDLRTTELHTLDGRIVLIPNADVMTKPITNLSRSAMIRVDVSLGVAYQSDLERVRQTAEETAASLPGVRQTPAPRAVFQAVGAGKVDLTLYFWVDTPQIDPIAGRDAALTAVKAAFDREGIAIL